MWEEPILSTCILPVHKNKSLLPLLTLPSPNYLSILSDFLHCVSHSFPSYLFPFYMTSFVLCPILSRELLLLPTISFLFSDFSFCVSFFSLSSLLFLLPLFLYFHPLSYDFCWFSSSLSLTNSPSLFFFPLLLQFLLSYNLFMPV